MDQAIHREFQIVAENGDIAALAENTRKTTVPD
jgi:hypothetical protein